MIQAALFIALGFCLATLLAAALFPAIYKRTVRLTKEAVQAVNPSSYAEVRASQDIERASHALALRRVEEALEQERAKSVEHRIQAGRLASQAIEMKSRHANEIASLQRTLKDAEKSHNSQQDNARDLGRELEQTRRHLTQTEQALAAARVEADLLKKQPEPAAWQSEADTLSLATIASLESQIATLKAQLSRNDTSAASIDPLLDGEMDELRSLIARLEADLVDAEAKYIAAQAEVTRLSMAAGGRPASSSTAENERIEELERALKWADDEKARLTALFHGQERAVERAKIKVAKLQKDLRRAPELKALRGDLSALSTAISGSEPITVDSSPSPHTVPDGVGTVQIAKDFDEAPENGAAAANTNANILLSRIIRSSQSRKPEPQIPQNNEETVPSDTEELAGVKDPAKDKKSLKPKTRRRTTKKPNASRAKKRDVA